LVEHRSPNSELLYQRITFRHEAHEKSRFKGQGGTVECRRVLFRPWELGSKCGSNAPFAGERPNSVREGVLGVQIPFMLA
jgi:hypothetical protein